MKKSFLKVFSLLSASFFFLPEKKTINSCFVEKTNQNKSFFKNKKSFPPKKNSLSTKALNSTISEKKLHQLNQTSLYFLVTSTLPSTSNENLLLLLQPEDRFDNEKVIENYNRINNIFRTLTPNKKTYSLFRSKNLLFFEKKSTTRLGSRSLRESKPYYYSQSLEGYKSICPVFFEKKAAEDFLLATGKEAFQFVSNLVDQTTMKHPETKTYFESLLNTKIIKVGFGDFLRYYEKGENENLFEFLMIPSFTPQSKIRFLKKESQQEKEEKLLTFLSSQKTPGLENQELSFLHPVQKKKVKSLKTSQSHHFQLYQEVYSNSLELETIY